MWSNLRTGNYIPQLELKKCEWNTFLKTRHQNRSHFPQALNLSRTGNSVSWTFTSLSRRLGEKVRVPYSSVRTSLSFLAWGDPHPTKSLQNSTVPQSLPSLISISLSVEPFPHLFYLLFYCVKIHSIIFAILTILRYSSVVLHAFTLLCNDHCY